MRKSFLALLLILSLPAFGRVEVAFFRCYDWYGNLIQMEKGGEFCHVAIRYGSRWLHAHPLRGVVLANALEGIGVGEYAGSLKDEKAKSLKKSEVELLIGLAYDETFKWESTKKTYCSKLVGKLLGIQPQPMDFSAPYWKQFANLPVGELGISPDGVYRQLKVWGYQHQ